MTAAWEGAYPGAQRWQHLWRQRVGSCFSHPAQQVSPFPHFSPFSLPRGDLEIIYPELGDVGCTYIPKCHQFRRRISREWGSPRVRYPRAEKVSPEVQPDGSEGNPWGRIMTRLCACHPAVGAGPGWATQPLCFGGWG